MQRKRGHHPLPRNQPSDAPGDGQQLAKDVHRLVGARLSSSRTRWASSQAGYRDSRSFLLRPPGDGRRAPWSSSGTSARTRKRTGLGTKRFAMGSKAPGYAHDGCLRLKVALPGVPTVEVGREVIEEAHSVGLEPTLEHSSLTYRTCLPAGTSRLVLPRSPPGANEASPVATPSGKDAASRRPTTGGRCAHSPASRTCARTREGTPTPRRTVGLLRDPCVGTLRSVLEFADVEPNPVADRHVRLPRKEVKVVEPPSADEVAAIIANAPKRWRLALRVLEQTGLRVGELQTLTWEISTSRARGSVSPRERLAPPVGGPPVLTGSCRRSAIPSRRTIAPRSVESSRVRLARCSGRRCGTRAPAQALRTTPRIRCGIATQA